MAATTTIPRFLLPQSGLIWRGVTRTTTKTGRVHLRLASTTPPTSGPRVLEKPTRFNPPSHGSRLPRQGGPKHYGGDLSQEEVFAQARKEYPGMMAPVGTLAYRIISSKWIHLCITLGTLTSLAIWTWTMNLKRNSPFADMIPPGEDFLRHPFSSIRMLFEVIRLDELRTSAIVAEKREREVSDVGKRQRYRTAHGLPREQGIESIFGLGKKDDEKPAIDAHATEQAAVSEGTVAAVAASEEPAAPRKKFLGIF